MTPLDIPIEIGREEARRLAAEELGGRGYDQTLPTWLTDFLRWLSELAARIFERLGRLVDGAVGRSPSGDGSADGSGWLVVGVVLALLALALLVWRVGLPRMNRRNAEVDVAADAETSAEQYRTLAEQAADRGDWPRALLEEFRALVRELEHLTVIDPRPSRTAWEVAGRAALVLPAADAELRAAATGFNDAMYGDTPATAEQWQALRQRSEAVLAVARSTDLSEVPA